jgi:hypothetical protein
MEESAIPRKIFGRVAKTIQRITLYITPFTGIPKSGKKIPKINMIMEKLSVKMAKAFDQKIRKGLPPASFTSSGQLSCANSRLIDRVETKNTIIKKSTVINPGTR